MMKLMWFIMRHNFPCFFVYYFLFSVSMHFYMLIYSSYTFQPKFYEMRKFLQINLSRFETQVCLCLFVIYLMALLVT